MSERTLVAKFEQGDEYELDYSDQSFDPDSIAERIEQLIRQYQLKDKVEEVRCLEPICYPEDLPSLAPLFRVAAEQWPPKTDEVIVDLKLYMSELSRATGNTSIYSCIGTEEGLSNWQCVSDVPRPDQHRVTRQLSSWPKQRVDELFSRMPTNQGLPSESAIVQKGSRVFEYINELNFESIIIQRRSMPDLFTKQHWYLLLAAAAPSRRLSNHDQAVVASYSEQLLKAMADWARDLSKSQAPSDELIKRGYAICGMFNWKLARDYSKTFSPKEDPVDCMEKIWDDAHARLNRLREGK